MYDSKAFSLFATLNPSERHWFRKWVESPYHNSNTLIISFLDYIDTRKSYSKHSLKKEKISAVLWPDQPFHDQKWRSFLSEFLRQLEGFTATETLLENPFLLPVALAKTYRRRGLFDAAEAVAQKTGIRLANISTKSARDYADTYAWHQENHYRAAARVRAATTDLQAMLDDFEHYFVAESLKNACVAISHQTVTGVIFPVPYLDSILQKLRTGAYTEVSVIQFYYYCYSILADPQATAHYHALRALLPKAERFLPSAELRNILLLTINYCIRRMNTGETNTFARETLGLYRLGLKNGALLENGHLSPFTFKNAVTIALKIQKILWADAFVRRYSPSLSPEYRAAYTAFCQARIAYVRHRPDEAIALLQGIVFDDIFLELDARVLMFKIWYEQEAFRLLQSFLVTFERFIVRKKLPSSYTGNYLNIVRTGSRLLKIARSQPDTEQIDAFVGTIHQTAPLTEKAWFLEMTEKLRTS